MPSHMACLGFEIQGADEFSALIQLAAQKSEPLPTHRGAYHPWRLGNGVELWAQQDGNGKLTGLSPHFRGKTSQVVGLSSKYATNESPLDGAFKAWVNPGVDRTETPPYVGGDYPFLFNCPAFDWFQDLPLPVLARVQLAAFPQKIEFLPVNEQAEPLELGELKVDEEFFIPVGTFREANDETPEAISLFGGKVLCSQTFLNPFTRLPFTLATVRTYGMDIDVVIPQSLMTSPLAEGQFIRGEFWISGLIEEIMETFEALEDFDQFCLFLQVEVAGTQYQVDADKATEDLRVGQMLKLVREPANTYDKNAVAVYTQIGNKLGYIPRWQNQKLAGLMDVGLQPRAYLVGIEGESFAPLSIRVYSPEALSNTD